MNTKYSRHLIITLLVFSAAACFGQDWAAAKLDSVASIQFPVAPTEMPIGNNKQLVASYENIAYIAMGISLEGYSAGSGDSLTAFYKDVVKGMQTSVTMQDIHVKDFMFNGKRGAIVNYKLDEGKCAITRLLLLGSSMYSFSVITADDKSLQSASITKFFNSFSAK